MTDVTTWPSLRAALVASVTAILELNEGQCYWATDHAPIAAMQVRLSVVSDLADADARDELSEDEDARTATECRRITVQVLIETSDGEGNDEVTDDAQTLAAKLSLAFQHRYVRDALKLAGIALVMKPGAIRSVDYQDREQGYWICARFFELPLRANFRYEVPLDADLEGEILEVIGEGAGTDYHVVKP